MVREFFTDNNGVAQMAHLLAFMIAIAGLTIVGFGLKFIADGHPDGVQTLMAGVAVIAGGGVLEGFERGGERPGK